MTDALDLTARIVAAHVSGNAVEAGQLPELIRSVHGALTKATQPASESPEPAVPIRKSVFKDHIVCLECAKNFRVLKGHLAREHGISIPEYRARFNLPPDYPVVAPEYAEARSEIAKLIGLGRTGENRRRGRK